MFDDTHYVVRSYNKQGFIILFPYVHAFENEVSNLLVGDME